MMIRKVQNIISLILLMVFVLPTLVKVLHHHHHEHLICTAKNENHFHEYKEQCAVCNFEFSVFSSDFDTILLAKEQAVPWHYNNYRSANFSELSNYSFLLRAPPYKQI